MLFNQAYKTQVCPLLDLKVFFDHTLIELQKKLGIQNDVYAAIKADKELKSHSEQSKSTTLDELKSTLESYSIQFQSLVSEFNSVLKNLTPPFTDDSKRVGFEVITAAFSLVTKFIEHSSNGENKNEFGTDDQIMLLEYLIANSDMTLDQFRYLNITAFIATFNNPLFLDETSLQNVLLKDNELRAIFPDFINITDETEKKEERVKQTAGFFSQRSATFSQMGQITKSCKLEKKSAARISELYKTLGITNNRPNHNNNSNMVYIGEDKRRYTYIFSNLQIDRNNQEQKQAQSELLDLTRKKNEYLQADSFTALYSTIDIFMDAIEATSNEKAKIQPKNKYSYTLLVYQYLEKILMDALKDSAGAKITDSLYILKQAYFHAQLLVDYLVSSHPKSQLVNTLNQRISTISKHFPGQDKVVYSHIEQEFLCNHKVLLSIFNRLTQIVSTLSTAKFAKITVSSKDIQTKLNDFSASINSILETFHEPRLLNMSFHNGLNKIILLTEGLIYSFNKNILEFYNTNKSKKPVYRMRKIIDALIPDVKILKELTLSAVAEENYYSDNSNDSERDDTNNLSPIRSLLTFKK